MKSLSSKLVIIYLLIFPFTVKATMHYVSLDSTNPVSPYTSWATAATNIQSAVDVAVSNDSILVTNGTYQTGGRSLAGTNRVTVDSKALIVQSVNGPAVTVIKGYQVPGTTNGTSSVRCVYLASGSILSGFTLTNGSTSGSGGGINCQSRSVTVSNCVVTGNSSSSDGGGSYSGTYVSCIISGNTAGSNGGGNSGGSFINCVLRGNASKSEGGGAYYPGSLVNCTVVGNNAGAEGGGVYAGVLANCVVYDNTSSYGSNIFNTSLVSNCCTYPTNNFNGLNVTNPPDFVNLSGGDLHLQPWSPGVNAGNNGFITNAVDLDGNPRVAGGTVDIGAYEFKAPVRFVSLGNAAPVSPFTNWSTAATNIQDAIDVANAGDWIVVGDGMYQTGGRAAYGIATNRVTVDKSVTVQSVNGAGATTIAGATFSGSDYQVRGVYLARGAVLIGFTVTNGGCWHTGDVVREESGGGIWCEDNSVMISDCVLAGNTAPAYGGGAYRGTLLNCTLANNWAGFGGGACSNILINCTLVRNTANQQVFNSGGGAFDCTLSNCLVVGNVCNGGTGGGACFSTLTGCVVSNNSAASGGGVCFGGSYNSLISSNRASSSGGGACSNALNNCVVRNNRATMDGGGVYKGVLNNCTVVSNTAAFGSGGGCISALLNNCIIYCNSSPQAANFTGDSVLSFCDTTPLPASGTGNITNDPVFLNAAAGDFHLQAGSPCINAGNNAYVAGLTDLDGNARIAGGTVDIGAYEVQSPASVLSYAWAQQYALPTDGSADALDSDGDGMSNWQEWRAGTNPTNCLSLLQMYCPAKAGQSTGLTVSWQSVAGVKYCVQRGSDLSARPPFATVQSDIIGQAGTTSFTDVTATNSGSYFYRVGAQ
ncbi:MAG: choice-of-anchor Q domain-containing protein [Verrucomicrobiae bacterium]|nr:choice-of-anchor Q domain-containing protein [Verrucomicrobiae bacterium]